MYGLGFQPDGLGGVPEFLPNASGTSPDQTDREMCLMHKALTAPLVLVLCMLIS